MGADIHTFFQVKKDNKWELIWEPSLHKDWWYDAILDEQLENGIGLTAFAEQDPDKLYHKLHEYYKNMPLDVATKEYRNNSNVVLEWNLPKDIHYDSGFSYSSISSRNYQWFSYLANVRGDDGLFGECRGIPSFIHPEIYNEYKKWEGDAHSDSWLMVNEILRKSELKKFQQYEWLVKNIEDPENSCMIFWFDN